MSDRRLQDLIRFYSILNELEKTIGARALADCRGRMKWPARGVYFFREAGESRSDTGEGLRVVRVGTHALKAGGSTTLWSRLSTHRGQVRSGGGNHRTCTSTECAGPYRPLMKMNGDVVGVGGQSVYEFKSCAKLGP